MREVTLLEKFTIYFSFYSFIKNIYAKIFSFTFSTLEQYVPSLLMGLHKTIWEDCYLAKNVFSWKIICLFVVECEKVQLSCNWRKMRESSSVPKHSLVVMVNLSKKIS